MIDDEIRAYYQRGDERDRLLSGGGALELIRTQELLQRYVPPPPASVLDVGGGPGTYAAWLLGLGYVIYLIDLIPIYV